MKDFCEKVAWILDVQAVVAADDLDAFPEWDSLSVLSVIAMCDADYGVNLTAMDLKDARTVGDLWHAVQVRKPRP